MNVHKKSYRHCLGFTPGMIFFAMLFAMTGTTPLHAKSEEYSSSGQKAEPSTLDKIGTGTKNFFSGIGNTLTGKKDPPKKELPSNPWVRPAKEESKPNWFAGMFVKQEDKKKSKTPSKWISQKRTDTSNR